MHSNGHTPTSIRWKLNWTERQKTSDLQYHENQWMGTKYNISTVISQIVKSRAHKCCLQEPKLDAVHLNWDHNRKIDFSQHHRNIIIKFLKQSSVRNKQERPRWSRKITPRYTKNLSAQLFQPKESQCFIGHPKLWKDPYQNQENKAKTTRDKGIQNQMLRLR